MPELPLSGTRVLEVGGGIAAAYATRWMAGFGADVVRSEGPPGALSPDEEVYLAAGKRRVAADADLRALALAADILVEDGPPGALAARGANVAELRREKPALVAVSITPFGQSGPYAGYAATNAVSFAMGGIMSLTGHPAREPLVTGGSQAQYLGGLNGFSAGMAAYFGSLLHGEGDHVDISLQECAAGMLELYGPRSAYDGSGPALRSGNHVRAIWAIYPCLDGFAGVCALERQVPALFRAIGDPVLQEERFTDMMQRALHDDELQAIFYGWFMERTKEQILAMGPLHKVPFGAVLSPADLLKSPSLDERGFFDTFATPGGTARMPGRPFLGLEWRAGELHAPGADTDAVAREWLGVGA